MTQAERLNDANLGTAVLGDGGEGEQRAVFRCLIDVMEGKKDEMKQRRETDWVAWTWGDCQPRFYAAAGVHRRGTN